MDSELKGKQESITIVEAVTKTDGVAGNTARPPGVLE